MQKEETRKLLSSEQWALDLGHRPGVADWASKKNKQRLDRFCDLVVPMWSPDRSPANPELETLRSKLKPMRDKILAHAIDAAEVDRPTINEVRRFVSLTLDLATDVAFALLGTAVDAETYRKFSREQAARFWEWAFKAPTRDYHQHMKQLGSAEDSEDGTPGAR